MELRKIFDLVQRLSKSEKANFTRWMKNQLPSLDRVLYERIASIRKWDEYTDAKVRKGAFDNPATYYLYRNRLATKLLTFLTSSDGNGVSIAYFFQKAVSWDMSDIVLIVLVEEMKRGFAVEDYSALRYWHEIVQEASDRYGVGFDLPSEIPSYRETRTHLEEISSLQDLLLHIKTAIRISPELRSREADKIEKEVRKAQTTSRTAANLKLKANKNLAVLRGDFHLALDRGELLISRMQDWSDFRQVLLFLIISSILPLAGILDLRDHSLLMIPTFCLIFE